MGAVNLKLNGQSVILTAAKTTEDGTTTTVYSDSVGGTSVSLPHTYTADTTVYLVNGDRTLSFTQQDGTAFHDQRVIVQAAKTQVVDLRASVLDQLADLEGIKGPVSGSLKSGIQIGSGGQTLTVCTGTPEAAVTAPVGSLALRTDGSTSTTLYVKTSGSGNTGWTAK